jgi:WhiB family redox-sensing transcriptional regulator
VSYVSETKDVNLYAPPWLAEAACVGEDPNLFFADQGKVFSGARTKAAIRVCQSCPVVRKCLAWALETGDGFAVLGGMTPQQRTRYRRELRESSVRRMA